MIGLPERLIASLHSRAAWWVGVVALVLYLPTLRGTFIYDDRFHCEDDPRLADPSRWGAYFTNGYYPGGVDRLWRPWVSLSYAVQHWLHGPRAGAFHAVNIALHGIVSMLVARLACRLACGAGGQLATSHDSGDPPVNFKRESAVHRAAWIGLVAGLLFAAHPVHVEAVAYLVGRAETMCAAGTLGAMLLVLRPGDLSVGRTIAIWACVVLAIGSKEQGLMAGPLLLALGFWRRHSRDARAAGTGTARTWRSLAACLLVTLAGWISWREHILGWYWEPTLLDWGTQPMIRSGPLDRALLPLTILGRYTLLLIAPLRLSPDYGLGVIGPEQPLHDPILYLGIGALLAWVIGVIFSLRRRAWTVLFLLGGFALTYGLIANVKLIGTTMGERLIYLPSVFVLIIMTLLLARLPWRARCGIVTVLVVLYSTRSVSCAVRWNDRLSFYELSLRDRPNSARLSVLLADELISRGKLDQADHVLAEGIARHPGYWRLWSTRARSGIASRRFEEAQRAILRAWDLGGHVLELMDLQGRLDAAKSNGP